MGKRQRTPHFITSLGDGNGPKNLRSHSRSGDDFYLISTYKQRGQVKPNERLVRMDQPDEQWNDIFDSPARDEVVHAVRSAKPWQIQAFAVFGMIILLSALFFYLMSEKTESVAFQHSRRSRSGTRKKKTDEWSDDEYESSFNHSEDGKTIRDKLNPPQLYYPYHQRYSQQQHRHRKLSATGSEASSAQNSGFRSRNYYLNQTEGAVVPAYYSQTATVQPRSSFSSVDAAAKTPIRSTSKRGSDKLTEGLEGYMSSHHSHGNAERNRKPISPISSFNTDNSTSRNSEGGANLDMSSQPPLHQFSNRQALPGIQAGQILSDQQSHQLYQTSSPTKNSLHKPSFAENDASIHSRAPYHPQQSDRSLSQYGSDRVMIHLGSDDDMETPRAGQKRMHNFHFHETPVVRRMSSRSQQQLDYATPSPFDHYQAMMVPSPSPDEQQSVPFLPRLHTTTPQQDVNHFISGNTAVDPPPRSISVEELQLVEMESGRTSLWQVRQNQYPGDTESHVHSVGQSQLGSPSRNNDYLEYNNEATSISSNLSQSHHSSASSHTSEHRDNDPRKGIVHKRKDLTTCTDSSSSLQSSIEFSELTLQEVIGGGGFGQVWKAMWRGTPVAVKILTGSAQAKHVSKAILEEFAAEINLLKGMRHPNICLYMGACLDPPNRAIITELAANGSLWDALRLPLSPPFVPCDGISRTGWPERLYYPAHFGSPPSNRGYTGPLLTPPEGTWSWELVKRVACGAARGMAYLHSGKPPILHRDMKSANILLDESYTAKVCDFGLSRLKAQERSMTGNCGTVQWMAPEVLANQSYNEKADVYSYGIICWELLTGDCPYEGMSPIQCALAVLNKDERPQIPIWCPPSLRAMIKSCVTKNPNDRPTFGHIIEALDAML